MHGARYHRTMADAVRITEVALRDGLQNEPGLVPTVDKAALARLLLRTGADEIELTSFVSKAWIPQLGDATELCALVARDLAGGAEPVDAPRVRLPILSALVPNERGMRALLEVNDRAHAERGVSRFLGKAALFTAASETFSKRNTNASISETIERFGPVVAMARDAGVLVRGYVSCAIECPFEGAIDPSAVARVAEALAALGVDEIDLGDTIGAGTPETTATLVRAVAASSAGATPLTLHLHDTRGLAVACALAAAAEGVRSFDASAAGLGGCPYASREGAPAPGNVATALLAGALRAAGFTVSIDDAALARADALARELVQLARASARALAGEHGS